VKQKKPRKYPKNKTLSDEDISTKIDELWFTKNGQVVPIKNLRDSHIVNILKFMNKHKGWRVEYKPTLLHEQKRRKQEKLIKKTKAGKLLYGKK
jgi:hypothetical protein